ncbi:hypothetical protein HK104_011425 [Borealophlyctis nickersoniae]|nr:hypothetical protein HK104_011425 [Borealophlyctis nickersoniae]
MSADSLEDDLFIDDTLVGPDTAGEEDLEDAVIEEPTELTDDAEAGVKRKRGEEEEVVKPKKKKKPKKPRKVVEGESPEVPIMEAAEVELCTCEEFTAPHTGGNYADFVKTLLPNYEKELTNPSKRAHNGSPRVIILASGANRVVDIIRRVKTLGKCAKLFARHMKMADQIKLLKNEKTPIAVGTPNRVLKLLDIGDGALDLAKLAFVILDGKKDAKERTIFDIPDIEPDLVRLLAEIRKQAPEAKICIY